MTKSSLDLGTIYIEGECSNHYYTMPLEFNGELIIVEPF